MAAGDEVNPSLEQVIWDLVDRRTRLMHTSFPGTVQSYDQAKQTATIQPVVARRYRLSDGEIHTEPMPVIAEVPVLFPSGGGMSITWPLVGGDPVTVVIAERSLAEWKANAKAATTPGDTRRFDLSDAVAIPGGRSPASPLTGVSATNLVVTASGLLLGSTTASESYVLGDAFKALYDAHTHTTGVGPSGVPIVLMDVVPGTHLSKTIKGE